MTKVILHNAIWHCSPSRRGSVPSQSPCTHIARGYGARPSNCTSFMWTDQNATWLWCERLLESYPHIIRINVLRFLGGFIFFVCFCFLGQSTTVVYFGPEWAIIWVNGFIVWGYETSGVQLKLASVGGKNTQWIMHKTLSLFWLQKQVKILKRLLWFLGTINIQSVCFCL